MDGCSAAAAPTISTMPGSHAGSPAREQGAGQLSSALLSSPSLLLLSSAGGSVPPGSAALLPHPSPAAGSSSGRSARLRGCLPKITSKRID